MCYPSLCSINICKKSIKSILNVDVIHSLLIRVLYDDNKYGMAGKQIGFKLISQYLTVFLEDR